MIRSFLLALCLTVSLSAQWISLNPYPIASDTYIGSAPAEQKYITVTRQGAAVITTNGGNTWTINPIGVNGYYKCTFFISESVGWAAGIGIYKTSDGGNTWTLLNSIDTVVYDIFFISEEIGWAVGVQGLILKTTNGGTDWISLTNPSVTTKNLTGVYATDLNNVHIVGYSDVVLRSTDGGNTFVLLPQIFSDLTTYYGVFFPPTATGFRGFIFGSESRIAKTENGGASWTPVFDGGGQVSMFSMDFNINGIGLTCGGYSQVLRSTNNGDTWNLITGFPPMITFNSIRFGRYGSENIVYLSGSSGYIFKSTDAGLTWTELSRRTNLGSLSGMSFADNLTGYIAGYQGSLAKTTDGGYNWTQQSSPWSSVINDIKAVTPDLVLAACDNGTMLRTSDGGSNWSFVPSGVTTYQDIISVDFTNQNVGMAGSYPCTITKTTDGGLTWNIVGDLQGLKVRELVMIDSLYIRTAGVGDAFYASDDGGITWRQQFVPSTANNYCLSFANRNNGVSAGMEGCTYFTTNGGEQWLPSNTQLNEVWGIKLISSPIGLFGMAVCGGGYVYTSRDSGKTWIWEPRLTTDALISISMTDAANAFIAGTAGVILRYYEPDNLPVELSSFDASIDGNNVLLNWTTASEINNSGFAVERKLSGQNWSEIAFIKGKGTTTSPNSYSYFDAKLGKGVYYYRIKQIDFNGNSKMYELKEAVEIFTAGEFYLSQNYPNPFNPSTVISYNLPENSLVSLKVYDILGNEIAVLVNEFQSAGRHDAVFSSKDLNISSGVYFYTIKTGGYNQTKKMMIIK